LHGRFHRNLFAQVQVSMESGHVFSDFLIIRKGTVTKVSTLLNCVSFLLRRWWVSVNVCIHGHFRRRVSVFMPTASFQKQATQNRHHQRQKSGQKTALLQDATLLCQRRLLDRQSSDVLSSSTQVCFLMTAHRNVDFITFLAHSLTQSINSLLHFLT